MTAAETLAKGRAFAEDQMIDTCTITRATGTRAFAAGTYTAVPTETVYSGPCQVQIGGNADALTPEVGETAPTIQQLLVKVPVTAEPYQVNDLVTIDAAVLDPSLVGRHYRVDALHGKSYATARRLQCSEVTRA